MLSFFLFFVYMVWSLCSTKSLKKQSKINPKSLKIEARGGSGGSWGRPGRHFGPKAVQSRKKGGSWPLSGFPLGRLFGHFSAQDRFRSIFLSFFWYIIFRFVFLSILGEFRVRNLGICQVTDMPEVW